MFCFCWCKMSMAQRAWRRRVLVCLVALSWLSSGAAGAGFALREGDFRPYESSEAQPGDSIFCSQPAEASNILFLTSAPQEAPQQWQIQNVAARCLHAAPVRLLAADNRSVLSFSTTFTFALAPASNASSAEGVDGLAFVVLPALAAPPARSSAGFLGLLNGTSDGHTFAVEFDSFPNPEFRDYDGDHVGIDVNSLVSAASSPAGYTDSCDGGGEEVFRPMALKDGAIIQAWIDYNASTRDLSVTLSPVPGFRPRAPLLRAAVELAGIVREQAFVGFSSSTGRAGGFAYVFRWSFSVGGAAAPVVAETLAPANNTCAASIRRRPSLRLVLGIAVPAAAAVLLAMAALGACYLRRARRRLERQFRELMELESASQRPKKFSYKELSAATASFSAGRELGSGGFGTVYRGVLAGGAAVAVKRIAPDASERSMAEVEIIGRCHHRNLVRLLGWCRERGELLLVSEYMPNGSLDKWLFGGGRGGLPWGRRRRVLEGVAAALTYLHEEWKQVVLHRDVKASNVLLDEDYNGKLGDFGLARLHDRKPRDFQGGGGGGGGGSGIVAGTVGYLAPEARTRGRFTDKSDVYGFGALALEVATGRRPVEPQRPSEEVVLLLWVWDLYEKGRLLDAVDAGLGEAAAPDGGGTRGEITTVLQIGLLCSHPDPDARPAMAQVVQMLKGEAPLPPVRPVPRRSKSRPPSFSFALTDGYIWADHSVELGMIENSEEIKLIPQSDHSRSFSKESAFSFVL